MRTILSLPLFAALAAACAPESSDSTTDKVEIIKSCQPVTVLASPENGNGQYPVEVSDDLYIDAAVGTLYVSSTENMLTDTISLSMLNGCGDAQITGVLVRLSLVGTEDEASAVSALDSEVTINHDFEHIEEIGASKNPYSGLYEQREQLNWLGFSSHSIVDGYEDAPLRPITIGADESHDVEVNFFANIHELPHSRMLALEVTVKYSIDGQHIWPITFSRGVYITP